MAQINLKLNDEQVERTTRLAKQLCMKRAAYIRKAIVYFNEKTERELLAEQFKQTSAKCRRESLKVCREFEQIAELPEGT
jgi:predicted DNA-binding protein